MFKNNKNVEVSSTTVVESVIAESVVIEGTIKSDVSMEINGKINGEIISNSMVIIGEKAVINANITCTEIIIAGSVNGNVLANTRITIKPKGYLNGETKTKSFVIDDGGTFLGTSNMDTYISDNKIDNK